MKLKVLAVVIASRTYKVHHADAPSRTQTIHEYEKKHGYKSIKHTDVQVDQYHIVPKANAFYMDTQAFKLQRYLNKCSYDAVHFYFEDPGITGYGKSYWQCMFSFAFATEKKSGLKPYFFTGSNYDIPLRQVTNGLFYSIPSVGYSDFMDSLQY